MSDHIDIFNLIYSIKEKISDNDFLELNNKIQKLIQENNELRKEKNSSGKIIQIFSRESESIQYRYVSDESEEYFSEENISEEKLIEIIDENPSLDENIEKKNLMKKILENKSLKKLFKKK